MIRTSFACVSIALLSSTASAGVFIVGGPSQTHATIQAAVDAAADGDVVLVRTNSASAFTIDGKGIAVLGDGAMVAVYGQAAVRNVPASKTAVLSNLHVNGSITNPPMLVQDCAGSVRIQGCEFVGGPPALLQGTPSGGHVLNCADVALTGCTLSGGNGQNQGMGGVGLFVLLSNLAVSNSSITGGAGTVGGFQFGSPTPGSPGGAGILANNSQVYIESSVLVGGPGGPGLSGGVPQPTCTTAYEHPTPGGAGGDATWALGTTVVRVRATNLVGGVGGPGGLGTCADANAGPTGAQVNGNVVALAGAASTLTFATPTREGQSIALHATGAPGDRLYLLSNAYPSHVFNASLAGVELVAGPYRRKLIGTIGAGGTLDVMLPIGDLGPGVTNTTNHLQLVSLDGANVPKLGGARVAILLDAAY